MNNNFIEWNNQDVINWLRQDVKLFEINFDLIVYHNLTGRDLIDLNEENLKSDLKILRLHDRKHLMRKICELMRNLAEIETEVVNDPNSYDNTNIANKEDENSLMKIFKVIYEKETITLKCANNIKVEHVIKDTMDVFKLRNGDKIKGESNDIQDFYLTDKDMIIFPKENFICDILEDYHSANCIKLKEPYCFYLHSNKDKLTAETNNNKSNYKELYVNNVNNSKNRGNKKKISNDVSFERPKNENTYYKDFSISETAVKNRYVSFEGLDNLEKNGYSFINKKLNNHLNKTNEEKVTINSFYNISNLNNYNDKHLHSVNTSDDNINSIERKNILLSSSYMKRNRNMNEFNTNNKISKDNSNFNYKKLNFEDLSDIEKGKSTTIKIENMNDRITDDSGKGKIELDDYIKRISYKTSLNTSNDSERNNTKKMMKTDNNMKNNPISFRSVLNKTNKSSRDTNKSNEQEIENFLNTIKNRNCSAYISKDSKNQTNNTQTLINPFHHNRHSTSNITNNQTKNNIRHLIYRNITTETDKNNESYISN